jgi:hypothetical protein
LLKNVGWLTVMSPLVFGAGLPRFTFGEWRRRARVCTVGENSKLVARNERRMIGGSVEVTPVGGLIGAATVTVAAADAAFAPSPS